MAEWLQSYETAVGGINGDERQEKVHTFAERLVETEKCDQIISYNQSGSFGGSYVSIISCSAINELRNYPKPGILATVPTGVLPRSNRK